MRREIADKSGRDRPSKFLNAADQDDLLFMLRMYEVEKQYMDSWDVDHYMRDSVQRKNIAGIGALEHALAEWLGDFSTLDVSWRVGNPL
jgi:hypothetical protein